MDTITPALTLFLKYGWRQLDDLDPRQTPGGYFKPVFEFGAWKALVGRLWVTVYQLNAPGQIGDMDSHRTADIAHLERVVAAIAPPLPKRR